MSYELNPFTRKLDKVGAAGTGGGAVSVNFSAGSTSANLSAVTFANANNVSFGLNAGTITASVVPGAGGGIAASLSGNTAGVMAAISTGTMYLAGGNNVTLSQNANSVTISGPNTVAQTQFVLSNSNGVSFGTNGSTVTATVRTDYQSAGAYLTTAMQSDNAIVQSINGSSGTFSLNTGSSLSSSRVGNAITFGLASNITTALQSQGAYLTTAAQSNQVINSINGSTGTFSFNTGSSLSSSRNGNAVTWGLASNITTALQSTGNYLTTAMASNRGSDFVQANAAFAGTNASGTIASNGISVSVAAPGAAAEGNNHELAGNTAGNSTASGSTIQFIGGNNVTLSGTNGSQIRIDAGGGGAGVTYSRYNEFKESPMVAGEIGNGSLHIQPWLIPNLHMDRVVLHKAFSNATNSSFSFTVSDWVGIYTLSVSTLSLLHSVSTATNFAGSGTAGSYLSYGGGIKAVTMGLTQTLTDGMYWIGVIQRTTTGGGAGHTLNQVLNSQMNSTYRGLMGVATNATNQMSTGFGVYSATTSAMPASVAITQIQGNSSVFLRPPSLYFVSGTI